MKYNIISFFTAFIILLITSIQVQAKEPIIENPNLEEAIKYQLGIDSKVTITKSQLEELSMIDASWWNVSELTGIDHAIGLSSLYLEGNDLSNINIVRYLNQIQTLSLADNKINDVAPLENHRNLTMLDLSNNQINSVTPLKSIAFTGVNGGVSLANNRLVEIASLTTTKFPENPQSFFIDLSNNLLTSLNGLQNAGGITELSAENNNISSIDTLSTLKKLDYLNLTNNKINSFEGLANKPLSVLKMANNNLTSLNGLEVKSGKAYYYEFQNNHIKNIDGLANITQGSINLQGNEISDISPLENMEKGTVFLEGNPLSGNAMEIIYSLKKRGVTVTYDLIEIPGMDEKRLAGNSRYDTAVKISQKGWTTSKTVVLARGDSFPDALSGVPLAYKKDAPILLTSQNELVSDTKKEIERLKAEQVIILGGEAAVSSKVEEELKANGIKNVKRIAGSGRFDTAKKIAEEIGGLPSTAIIVYGYNFPDALSAASYAAQNGFPILLTDQKVLPQPTKDFVEKVQNTIIVGGEGVVGKEILSQLKDQNPIRIGGSSRFDTATKMISTLGMSTDQIYISNGYGYADALTGSVLAAKQKAPLLLVENDKLPKETKLIFTDKIVNNFMVLGGDVVVKDQVIFELTQLVK